MKKTRAKPVDKVRASRDGHEFHEAWAARRALQLIMPKDGLVGIAVEGLHPGDQKGLSRETVDVADLVLYYGEHPNFAQANTVAVVQFKYSIGLEGTPFRASDAKKTVRKFALAFRSHKRKYGAKSVRKKIQFELITNRPILAEFAEAIASIHEATPVGATARAQRAQFVAASGFEGSELIEFARKFSITGLAGSLSNNKRDLSRTLADWSGGPDAMARARLGNLRKLVRDKAGSEGDGRNVIANVDVLDALEVQVPEDLFPCPDSFPEVGPVVERKQLAALCDRIPKLDKTLLVHASGGLGKTVFLQSLAKTLGQDHKVILFDCFGGGGYRSPIDLRHLSKNGLVHIANKLAADGLCDPLLPGSTDSESLIRAFVSRLGQTVATLRRGSDGKQLLIFIDAIDNAAEYAKERAEQSFPTLLLECLHHSGSVPGVQLIVSCRTHRRAISTRGVPCEEVELSAFTESEASQYVRDRLPDATLTEIQVAYSRSSGVPRVLQYLVGDRGLLNASEITKKVELDELLRARIERALTEAARHGYAKCEIEVFLAGLSVLPPPVPLPEYADAHGMELGAVESFAADLSPLLENTKHGVMFRDEPTETLIRESYAADGRTLKSLADNLNKRQDSSVYAARALPELLQKIDDGESLFKLAFDDRFPRSIAGTVGKQNIRYARLRAAVSHAAHKSDFKVLVHFLLELSTLAAVNERGLEYLLDNPDLVVASGDIDAMRRLFEVRTNWAGTRFARLAIASTLAGDINDASRYASSAEEWILHHYRQQEDDRRTGPETLDTVCIPFCLIARGQGREAAQFLETQKGADPFEISARLCLLIEQAKSTGAICAEHFDLFQRSLTHQVEALAATIAFSSCDEEACRRLLGELVAACERKQESIEVSGDFREPRGRVLRDGLSKALAIALSLELSAEASVLSAVLACSRPDLWSYTERFANRNAFPFLVHSALAAAASGRPLEARDLLPAELVHVGDALSKQREGVDYILSLKTELGNQPVSEKGDQKSKGRFTRESKADAERFIDGRLASLVELTQAFGAVMAAKCGSSSEPFVRLVGLWQELRNKQTYTYHHDRNVFFDQLGHYLLTLALWTRSDLEVPAVRAFVGEIAEKGHDPRTSIDVVGLLAARPVLHEMAGEMAVKAQALIEREQDVSQRADLFAALSKAILPASGMDAATYFLTGLERMDAIGSGDNQFTNELLVFASKLKGEKLRDSEVHTLTNIVELNMPSEEEKFPWLLFAQGMVRASGAKALAKLGRWHDRRKISLDYTLLPYLAALLEQDAIDPKTALALLKLTKPAELHVCGTAELALLIERKGYPEGREIFSELVAQFRANHGGVFMPGTVRVLHEVAERAFGGNLESGTWLADAAKTFQRIQDEGDANRDHNTPYDAYDPISQMEKEALERATLQDVLNGTDPLDEVSMLRATECLQGVRYAYDFKPAFMQSLRQNVSFSDRPKYIELIAGLEQLNIDSKLAELNACKADWCGSSVSLTRTFQRIGTLFVRIHAYDFVSYSSFSGWLMKAVSELSGVARPVLALSLIEIFSAPDSHLSASCWVGLASEICGEVSDSDGQIALTRLLTSDAAKLSSSVEDGGWSAGLYPEGSEVETMAGLVWLMLGSPYATERWRAAHSIRLFAKSGRWDVVSALVDRLSRSDARPFQAPELVFYGLHARLWLMIALARIALDFPDKIQSYGDPLKAIALNADFPHILLRHFAAHALLACIERGKLKLSGAEARALRSVNKSTFGMRKNRTAERGSYYGARPASSPKPNGDFRLEHDFDKTTLDRLSDIFDVSRWDAKDCLTNWVRKFDSAIGSMSERGGRYDRRQDSLRGMTAWHQSYGQQLGWHGLLLTAGELLAKYPVLKGFYAGDAWKEWLGREVLTREDGLWLSDGVDGPPIETLSNLKERVGDALVLTSGKDKLLAILGITGSAITKELVVGGYWSSTDNVSVRVMSALVVPKKADEKASALAAEDASQAWLPFVEENENGGESTRSSVPGYRAWIVEPSITARFDETDPVGANSVAQRLRVASQFNELGSLHPQDGFQRQWSDGAGRVAVRSEAWGAESNQEDGGTNDGLRLLCSPDFLRLVLGATKSDLLILLILHRYEKDFGRGAGQYTHATAVVHVNQALDCTFYMGNNNQAQPGSD